MAITGVHARSETTNRSRSFVTAARLRSENR